MGRVCSETLCVRGGHETDCREPGPLADVLADAQTQIPSSVRPGCVPGHRESPFRGLLRGNWGYCCGSRLEDDKCLGEKRAGSVELEALPESEVPASGAGLIWVGFAGAWASEQGLAGTEGRRTLSGERRC